MLWGKNILSCIDAKQKRGDYLTPISKTSPAFCKYILKSFYYSIFSMIGSFYIIYFVHCFVFVALFLPFFIKPILHMHEEMWNVFAHLQLFTKVKGLWSYPLKCYQTAFNNEKILYRIPCLNLAIEKVEHFEKQYN